MENEDVFNAQTIVTRGLGIDPMGEIEAIGTVSESLLFTEIFIENGRFEDAHVRYRMQIEVEVGNIEYGTHPFAG